MQSLRMSTLSAILGYIGLLHAARFSVSTRDACYELHVRSRSNVDKTLANRNDVLDFSKWPLEKKPPCFAGLEQTAVFSCTHLAVYVNFQEVKTSILSEQSKCFLSNIMYFAFILPGALGRDNKNVRVGLRPPWLRACP